MSCTVWLCGEHLIISSSVQGNEKVVMHRQAAIQADTTDIMDMKKKKKSSGIKKQDELAGTTWLSQSALTVLQGMAHQFIQTCFNRSYLVPESLETQSNIGLH